MSQYQATKANTKVTGSIRWETTYVTAGTYAHKPITISNGLATWSFDLPDSIPISANFTDVIFHSDYSATITGNVYFTARFDDGAWAYTSNKTKMVEWLNSGKRNLSFWLSYAPSGSTYTDSNSNNPTSKQGTCTFSNIYCTITYVAGATITTTEVRANIGETVTLNLDELSSVHHYTAIWSLNDIVKSTATNLNSDSIGYTFTSDALPNATQGIGKCEIISYSESEEELGRTEKTFEVLIPDTDEFKPSYSNYSVSPIAFTQKVSSFNYVGNNNYYQYYSCVQAIVQGVQAGSGTTIKQIYFKGDLSGEVALENNENSKTFNSKVIEKKGDLTAQIVIEDNRSRTKIIPLNITVIPVNKISVKEIIVTRAIYSEDSSSYVASVSGTYGYVSFTIDAPFIWEENSPFTSNEITFTLKATNPESPNDNYTYTNTINSSNNNTQLLAPIFGAELSGQNRYDIVLTVSDAGQELKDFVLGSIEKVHCNMHIDGSGWGVAIGDFCDENLTMTNPQFKCAYPMSLKLGDEYYTIRIGTSGEDGYITFVL